MNANQPDRPGLVRNADALKTLMPLGNNRHRPLLSRTLTTESVGINGRISRLRERTGIMFGPHTFRHTWAPELLRRGVVAEVAAQLLGHGSIAPTGTPCILTPRRVVVQREAGRASMLRSAPPNQNAGHGPGQYFGGM
jgi:site-specific recombinase XerD